MNLDDNGLEVLDVATCRTLLAKTRLGRVALSRQALPIIVPVVYTLVDQYILIPAASTLVRRAAHAGDVICFEADSHDDNDALWSVLVTGPLAVASPNAAGPPTDAWTDAADGDLVSLDTFRISGRRTTPAGGGLPLGRSERARRRT